VFTKVFIKLSNMANNFMTKKSYITRFNWTWN